MGHLELRALLDRLTRLSCAVSMGQGAFLAQETIIHQTTLLFASAGWLPHGLGSWASSDEDRHRRTVAVTDHIYHDNTQAISTIFRDIFNAFRLSQLAIITSLSPTRACYVKHMPKHNCCRALEAVSQMIRGGNTTLEPQHRWPSQGVSMIFMTNLSSKAIMADWELLVRQLDCLRGRRVHESKSISHDT